jgi:4-hydroxyphenylpyruvate dioxygenase
VQLWRQGGINLIANYEPHSPPGISRAEHGASACGMAFRVRDAAPAYADAPERGAEPVESAHRPDGIAHPRDPRHRRGDHLSGRPVRR